MKDGKKAYYVYPLNARPIAYSQSNHRKVKQALHELPLPKRCVITTEGDVITALKPNLAQKALSAIRNAGAR